MPPCLPQFNASPSQLLRIAAAACFTLLPSCVPPNQQVGPTIGDAVRYRDQTPRSPAQARRAPALKPDDLRAAGDEAVIATVNDAAISRGAVTDLLIRSHGVGVLEQLIGLETAAQAAAKKGVTITQQDVDGEYEQALRRLVNPLPTITPAEFDRAQAERLLDNVLADRNISRDEFFVVLRRNAYLRAILQREVNPADEQLHEEFQRLYGERAIVRHIQLGSPGDTARVQERLAAGEDFAALAARYSANSASAKQGGLLTPFARNDEDLPEIFRQTSFSLQPGQVSEVVRIGQWEHLIRLEKILPASGESLDAVRGELEKRVRGRLIEDRMPKLFEELFRSADVKIEDASLRESFFTQHPELRR